MDATVLPLTNFYIFPAVTGTLICACAELRYGIRTPVNLAMSNIASIVSDFDVVHQQLSDNLPVYECWRVITWSVRPLCNVLADTHHPHAITVVTVTRIEPLSLMGTRVVFAV